MDVQVNGAMNILVRARLFVALPWWPGVFVPIDQPALRSMGLEGSYRPWREANKLPTAHVTGAAFNGSSSPPASHPSSSPARSSSFFLLSHSNIHHSPLCSPRSASSSTGHSYLSTATTLNPQGSPKQTSLCQLSKTSKPLVSDPSLKPSSPLPCLNTNTISYRIPFG